MPRLTRAQRLWRSLRTVPASQTGRTWQDIVASPTGLAKVTGGRALDGDHPSRKHGPALTQLHPTPVDMSKPPAWAAEMYLAVPGSPTLRRRERRELARFLRADQKHVATR